ncbi:hypothetical protein PSY73_23800, partial [Shigella flexneri]|nr:hypothetical protein [Shigella flexneri]
ELIHPFYYVFCVTIYSYVILYQWLRIEVIEFIHPILLEVYEIFSTNGIKALILWVYEVSF